jgi:hypothetical protein
MRHLTRQAQALIVFGSCSDKYMWFGRELIDDLSNESMPDLYTVVGGEYGAADLQHSPLVVSLSRASFRFCHRQSRRLYH